MWIILGEPNMGHPLFSGSTAVIAQGVFDRHPGLIASIAMQHQRSASSYPMTPKAIRAMNAKP